MNYSIFNSKRVKADTFWDFFKAKTLLQYFFSIRNVLYSMNIFVKCIFWLIQKGNEQNQEFIEAKTTFEQNFKQNIFLFLFKRFYKYICKMYKL